MPLTNYYQQLAHRRNCRCKIFGLSKCRGKYNSEISLNWTTSATLSVVQIKIRDMQKWSCWYFSYLYLYPKWDEIQGIHGLVGHFRKQIPLYQFVFHRSSLILCNATARLYRNWSIIVNHTQRSLSRWKSLCLRIINL